MEVVSCTQKVSEHAASLLASLKLQRDSTLFCDCVIRQRQNPAHLYPAHRCVLAASSPVFAALLSSTGALLELCDPCLSDSVLALVLDYIYTGTLPSPAAHQQYYSLITAAGYLQMDGLQEALRARQLTEVKSSYMDTCMGAQNQLYSDSKSTVNCSMTPNLSISHNINTSGEYCKETYDQLNNKMSCCKQVALKTLSSGNVNNVYSITPVSTVSTFDTSCIAAVNILSSVSSEEERAQTHSPGSIEQEELEVSREEEQREEQRARVEKRGFGAVPVICHTSKVPRLEVVRAPPPQAATRSRRTAFHHPAGQPGVPPTANSEENGAAEDKKLHGLTDDNWGNGKQGCRCSNCNSESHHCGIHNTHFKANVDQYNFFKGDYKDENSSHCGTRDEEEDYGPPQMTDWNNHRRSIHCGTGTERHSDGKVKSEERQDSLNSKSHTEQVECSHMQAKEELASHWSDQRLGSNSFAVTSLPVSEHDSGSYVINQCSGRKEERNQEKGCFSSQNIGEKYGMGGVSSLQSTLVHVECSLSASSQGQMEEEHFGSNPPLKFENKSDGENSESNLTAVMAIVNNICSPVYNVEEETYHGNIHYHCTPSSPLPLDQSDQSNDIRSSSNPNQAPLTHSYSRETGTEILLLDISTKSAQLHVFHQTLGGERGIALGDGEPGGRTWDDDQQQGAMAKFEALDSMVVAREEMFEARTEIGLDIGTGADCDGREEASSFDTVSNVEATGLATSLAACMSPGLPHFVPATASPTLPVCIPKTFPVSLPYGRSGCISNPHQHPYQCLLCDRSFSQRGSLNRHVRSHLGVRPYPCPHCPMTFSRQYRVTEHMRVHQRCVLGGDLQKPPASFT